MGNSLPRLNASAETPDSAMSPIYDFEVVVPVLMKPSASGQHPTSDQLNYGSYYRKLVRRTIKDTLYLYNWTHCICLTVLGLGIK
ncbi:hypothetical protein TNIN_248271 [Trichonephila inaurata madagascariensis]|uniref:Uncharacterized protein n=1 Tax=Trichonephila inaurata madagascariensis TaxID=2747483 RepID=A0A8X7CG36_9ARAC|nr:hypothetical protein TNIN_248271 [Trichonephila inaurata madagascariensis]